MPASKFALPPFNPHPKSGPLASGYPWPRVLAQRASFPPSHELKLDEPEGTSPLFLRDGWACRIVMFPDGRRQILDLYLPGELISVSKRTSRKAAYVTLTAVDIAYGSAPLSAMADQTEREAAMTALQARAEEIEDGLLLQVLRLGRQSARERVASLLVEMQTRLERTGQMHYGSFAMPLTQETLGDILGLSVVHVNRTLQALKRQKLITTDGRFVKLRGLDELKALAGSIFQHG